MEEIKSRMPEIYEVIINDIRDKNWTEIKTELELLNWLIP